MKDLLTIEEQNTIMTLDKDLDLRCISAYMELVEKGIDFEFNVDDWDSVEKEYLLDVMIDVISDN